MEPQAAWLESQKFVAALNPVLVDGKQAGTKVMSHPRYRKMRIQVDKPPGTLRLALVGDSTIWGLLGNRRADITMQVYEQMTARTNLAAHISLLHSKDRPGKRLEILNLGLMGSISEIALARVRELAELDLDGLVIYVGNNDFTDPIVVQPLHPEAIQYSWLRRKVFIASAAVRLLIREAPLAKIKGRGQALLRNLRLMRDLAQQNNVPIIFVSPTNREDRDPIGVEPAYNALQAAGAEVVKARTILQGAADQMGAPYRDLFSDEVHPSRRGYLELAKGLMEPMRRAGMF